MGRNYLIVLILFYLSSDMYGNACDTMPVTSLTDLHQNHPMHRITPMWRIDDQCKMFSTFVLTSRKNCNPCNISMLLDVDTNATEFFISIRGPKFVILEMNSLPVEILKLAGNFTFFKLNPSFGDTVNITAQLYMPSGTSFMIEHYGVDSSEVDYISGRLRAYSGSNVLFSYFLGGLAILVLINLIWFAFNGRKDILMYAIYSAFVFLFFYSIQRKWDENVNEYWNELFIYISQPLSYVAYAYFIRYFINTEKNYPTLDKVLFYFSWFFIFCSISMAILWSIEWYSWNTQFYNIYRTITGVMGIYTIFCLIRRPNSFANYIILGGGFLLIGSLLCMLFALTKVNFGPVLPIHWMMGGTAIELAFFAAGIGYRTKLTQQDKISAQKALIKEMKKNEILLFDREETLKKEVLEVRTQITLEMKKKLSAEFSVKELEIELQSLRTQMNPHFIFNSLNSIKSFIIKNEPRIAADYLSKFAQLMRLILSHSKETTIPLNDELNAVKIYVELEQMRFNNKFEFRINVAEDLDANTISIQPLIIQPYIENAIWHGLMHK